MNTNGLAKMYEHLTPYERLPLIIAAVDRGDEAEAQRLSRSSPRLHVGLPDYHGLSEGLTLLVMFQVMTLLELAVSYWQLSGMLAQGELVADDDGVRLAAYLIVANVDAWNRLAGELKIDPETLLRDMGPTYEMLKRTEAAARAIAFTLTEAEAHMQKVTGEPAIVTAESIAGGMRLFLEARIKFWN